MACLSDAEIAEVLDRVLDGSATGAERAVEALIGAANVAGGFDNITVVLLLVP
jgi:serine/threonine protein phosphatase PrpC